MVFGGALGFGGLERMIVSGKTGRMKYLREGREKGIERLEILNLMRLGLDLYSKGLF